MKSRLQQESNELGRQLEEAESQISQLTKAKQALQKQLEEARANLEDESRMRAKLQGENRNLTADLDQMRDQLEEEQEGRSDVQRQLSKAQAEIQEWRRKFESGEGGVRSEELDDLKRKMNAKLAEAESQLEAALSKVSQLEKVKHRLNGEMEDLMIEVERVSWTGSVILFITHQQGPVLSRTHKLYQFFVCPPCSHRPLPPRLRRDSVPLTRPLTSGSARWLTCSRSWRMLRVSHAATLPRSTS